MGDKKLELYFNSAKDLEHWELTDEIVDNGNNEKQVYRPSMIKIDEEQKTCVITCDKLDQTVGLDRDYESGRLVSKNEFLYGTFHLKARVPMHQGSWAALWTLPSRFFSFEAHWPEDGELDIMEGMTIDGRKDLLSSIHWAVDQRNEKTKDFHPDLFDGDIDGLLAKEKEVSGNSVLMQSGPNSVFSTELCTPLCDEQKASEWHVYHMQWGPETIKFWYDDLPPHHICPPSVKHRIPHVPHRIIMNLAIGGDLGGVIDERFFPQTMEVEYVKWEALEGVPESITSVIKEEPCSLFEAYTPDKILLDSTSASNFQGTWEVVNGVEENGLEEQQSFGPECLSIEANPEGGNYLKICPKLTSNTHRRFLSSKIITKESFQFGTFRIRCRVPFLSGISVSASLMASSLLNGTTIWPDGGQIGVLESVSLNGKREFQSSVHWKKARHFDQPGEDNGGPWLFTIPPDGLMEHKFSRIRNNMAENFHTFNVRWTPDIIQIWYDKDAPHHRVDCVYRIPQGPCRLMIALTIGSKHLGGPIDDAAFSTAVSEKKDLAIDYIHYEALR
eukprot:Nk52_evm39s78 gene=Nk52_evmTU39s78